MDLNKVMLIGRITSDIQLRTIPSGQNVASFGIATNRRWKDQSTGEMKEDSQFHNIVAWRKLAEICSQYMSKGMRIFVEGRLQTRSWDDQQTGQKRYRTEILAENIIMLDKKTAGNEQSFQQPGQFQPQAPSNAGRENNVSIPSPMEIPTINLDDSQEEIKVEDIPF